VKRKNNNRIFRLHLKDPKIVNIERWLDQVNERNVRNIAQEGLKGHKV
jgi:hypothetical protein